MENCQHHQSASRKAQRAAGIVFVALLIWSLLADTARADLAEPGWQISVPFYVTAGAYFSSANAGSNVASSINATAELLVSSPVRPYEVAVFVNHHFSPDAGINGTVSVGTFVNVFSGRWDTTAYVFRHDAPQATGRWGYAGRLRYAVASRQKIGLEFLGAIHDSSARSLSLGYYGEITEALSITVVAGLGIRSSRQRSARTELVWQFN